MKQFVYAAMLLTAIPALAEEQARLVEMCEVSWAAYNNQDINLLRSFYQQHLEQRAPTDWSEEQKTAALEQWLGDFTKRHQRNWASYGHMSYELSEVRIFEKADVPDYVSMYNTKRYAVLSYVSHSTETPTKVIHTGCSFFDFDGLGNWLFNEPVM
ncbi:hypothetical protein ABC502_09030 [Alkalimonas sp. NCh-2]|uniref:hypothetical protein n=1 Tax=Alkalimonas sp. NCh-2 TaxID=3144846 RepID=UPI0031F63904